MFLKNRRGYERDARSDAYLRLRLSMYSDAANAEKATTATVLNSGTGVWNWELQVPDIGMGVLAWIVARLEFVNVIVS